MNTTKNTALNTTVLSLMGITAAAFNNALKLRGRVLARVGVTEDKVVTAWKDSKTNEIPAKIRKELTVTEIAACTTVGDYNGYVNKLRRNAEKYATVAKELAPKATRKTKAQKAAEAAAAAQAA